MERGGKELSDEPEEDEIYLYALVTELEDGEFEPKQLAIVEEGFMGLCLLLDDLDFDFWFTDVTELSAEQS